jgi:ubiquinone/menaquinone biosynthesis C-methylase UbiE
MDDAEKEWTFKDNTFDYIHLRGLGQGVSKWPYVLSEAFRCLKPGGFIEMAETRSECATTPCDSLLTLTYTLVQSRYVLR